MFTAAEAIAELDRALTVSGQHVEVKKTVAGVPGVGIARPAFVRGYKPDELVGDVMQNDLRVVLSPTGLAELPEKGWKVVVRGRTRNVEMAEHISMGATVVRLEMQVRG